jgi:hypothetical protein
MTFSIYYFFLSLPGAVETGLTELPGAPPEEDV